ncbi:MAG: dolichol-phosphate mannosyltransferase [Myxococcota bacterium]|jgi:dolichol-phosphate mannosyltransferase
MSPVVATDTRPQFPEGAGALIVMPTFNEKENLENIIAAIHAVVPKIHLLVVDDSSPDGTGDIADRLAADPRIFAVHRKGKLGLGTAYIHGFRWALERDYEAVFEMDADFSHQPRYLPDFLRALATDDLVLGCRYMPGGGTENWAWHRQLISRGGNLYARLVLGVPYTDLTGGFKCFRRSTIAGLDLDAIEAVGYGFQIELTYRTLAAGFSVGQVPIIFPDRTAGESKMSSTIFGEAAIGVWKLRLGSGKPR